jgi:predicted ATPase
MRYLQIQVKGYKSLADVTLDLHPLTVMIGPNGCGKTSALESFNLFREGAYGRLEEALTRLGGFPSLLTHTHQPSSRLELALRFEVTDSSSITSPVDYRFAIEPRGIGYVLALEHWTKVVTEPPFYFTANEKEVRYFNVQKNREEEITPNYRKPKELLLAQDRRYDEQDELYYSLQKVFLTNPLDIRAQSSIRLPQMLTPATNPGSNGESLFAALYNLREAKPTRSYFERVEEALHLAFSDFDRLELKVVGAGQVTLEWYQTDLTIPLYPNQLSDGTLRFLWLTTVLLSPEPPPLILIDEPEVSLHPELQKILAALLQDASARTQIIVATHSPELIRWLQPDEVVVIDKDEGKSTFTWASDPSLDLAAWLKEYTLADLWDMGNLGGRP